jgi:hypothetical protein
MENFMSVENDKVAEEIYEEPLVEEEVFAEVKQEDLDASLNAIKLEISEEDKNKYNASVPAPPKKKPGRQPKAKVDIPTPTEVNLEMSDEEIEKSMDQKTQDLYMEFNSFLEDKTEIKSDTGVKDTIPTGIDLVDAILGGGFAIGTMGVIVGNPGSGKCLHYDEVLEIYHE